MLERFFAHRNWAIRAAVRHDDLILVNQLNGGDEWCSLKIDGNKLVPSESITMRHVIERGEFASFIPAAAGCERRTVPTARVLIGGRMPAIGVNGDNVEITMPHEETAYTREESYLRGSIHEDYPVLDVDDRPANFVPFPIVAQIRVRPSVKPVLRPPVSQNETSRHQHDGHDGDRYHHPTQAHPHAGQPHA